MTKPKDKGSEKDFILASGSPQRLELLKKIGYVPKKIQPADIDETPKKAEKPTAYVKRMALEKALFVVAKNKDENVLGADTIVVSGAKIIQKSHNAEEQTKVMHMLSGKACHVLSAVCVVNKAGKTSLKLNTTRVLMKKMTNKEIKDYVDSKDWVGCVGFKIESIEYLIKKIIGSYSGVVGLPLYEAKNMLDGAGVK